MPNSPTPNGTDGFAQRFEFRPEFLFSNLVPKVFDAPVREHAVDDLMVFKIADVFDNTNEIFLGFGKPNVYLVVPDGNGSYQKFAAKSLRRAKATIETERRLVQSGILIRFKGLPAHAAGLLREAMTHHLEKSMTCVNANLRVMEDSGFSSPKRKLSSIYFPYQLLKVLLNDGLYFEGNKVEFDVIRTTPLSAEKYTMRIIQAELLTLWRHLDRKVHISNLFHKVGIGGKKKSSGKRVAREVAPALPSDVAYENDIEVQVSSANAAGRMFRMVWGTHALFRAVVSRVDVTQYATGGTLKAFPQPNPSLATRLKKWILFSRPVVKTMRWLMGGANFVDIGAQSERDIYDMMRTNSDASPNRYNIVISLAEAKSALAGLNASPRTRITIARISVAVKLIDWILSKHVLMSGYDPAVVFAGEIWKDADGVIHVSGNSGTYRPTDEMVEAIVAFLRAVFPHLTIVKD